MRRIVYSDGRLSDTENYLVRKLADLSGLEHHVMIEAKVAVLKERGETHNAFSVLMFAFEELTTEAQRSTENTEDFVR